MTKRARAEVYAVVILLEKYSAVSFLFDTGFVKYE